MSRTQIPRPAHRGASFRVLKQFSTLRSAAIRHARKARCPCPRCHVHCWTFHKGINEVTELQIKPRLSVNDPGLIHRLVVNGAGVGCLSAYMCAREMAAGRLVQLFPDWSLPHVDVSVVFPSSRAHSPAVRAFVEHMNKATVPGKLWKDETLAAEPPLRRRRAGKAKQSK
jgi:DNA-binding transcriptional LysR family regulator